MANKYMPAPDCPRCGKQGRWHEFICNATCELSLIAECPRCMIRAWPMASQTMSTHAWRRGEFQSLGAPSKER